jgi:uncharacterized protein YjbJ (UPF0337 family)
MSPVVDVRFRSIHLAELEYFPRPSEPLSSALAFVACDSGGWIVGGGLIRRTSNEGVVDELKGQSTEAAGAVTGKEAKKSERPSDQITGTAKEKKGKVKDLFK